MPEKIFYSMPFRAENLIKKGKLERCNLAVSVRQNLRLLLMTPPARVRDTPLYGCIIHWQQFVASNRLMEEDKRQEDNFKVNIERNVSALIERFEPRITLTEVSVHIQYNEEEHTTWRLVKSNIRENNVIQIIVNIKGKVKPQFLFDGQSLDLEDTIPLL